MPRFATPHTWCLVCLAVSWLCVMLLTERLQRRDYCYSLFLLGLAVVMAFEAGVLLLAME
jgi:hypothetical protein